MSFSLASVWGEESPKQIADFWFYSTTFRDLNRNMTWNGAQGFQTPIEPETFTVKDFGVFGNEHSERGLTCKFRLIRSENDVE